MSLQSITQILQTISTPVAKPTASTGWDDLVKERKIKFEVDPLVCAVSFFRRKGDYGLIDEKDHVIQDDLSLAKTIREYYLKKYFWNALKSNSPQSEYRTNAYRLLAIENEWHLTERECGLFVKLPAFYAEDQIYDKFKLSLTTDRSIYVNQGPKKSVVKRLEYLDKTFRWQGSKRVSYWFKDSQNQLYCYTTSHKHPFNALFEERIQTPQVMEFSCGIDNITDMYYNNIGSFSFVKE